MDEDADDDTQKRRIYIANRQMQSRMEREQLEHLQFQKEIKENDDFWKLACDNASKTGSVIVTSMKRGDESNRISPRIYNFKEEYNRPLRKLVITGCGLSSLEKIPQYCKSLVELSLASNSLVLDDRLAEMVNLTYLDVSNNNLEILDDAIGSLPSLHVLDISNNNLSKLPDTFVQLKALSTLKAECNRLEQFPMGIESMDLLEEIYVSSNSLTIVSSAISCMNGLRVFAANKNKITTVSAEVHRSNIIRMYLSCNHISQLPPSFVRMKKLEELWLDFNNLATLPIDFHYLTNLHYLKLEGNSALVNPPTHVVAKGIKEIMHWSRKRQALNEINQSKNIVLTVQSVLNKVVQHESIFERNVMLGGDKYFQLDSLATLFNIFIPEFELSAAGQSFPYERSLVENTLINFQDAGGKIMHTTKNARFRRCSCVNEKGEPNKCTPIDDLWQCKRKGILIRSEIILESIMVRKRRALNEQRLIQEAGESAKKEAYRFLRSEMGSKALLIFVTEQKEEKKDLPIEKLFEIESRLCQNPDLLKKEKHFLLKVFNRKKEIEQQQEITLDMERAKAAFVEYEVSKRKMETKVLHSKLRKVLDTWIGNSIEILFFGWKDYIRAKKKVQQNVESMYVERKQRSKQEEEELMELAKLELSLWQKTWDDFDERFVWVHSQSGQYLCKEPTIDMVISKGWNRQVLNTNKLSNQEIKNLPMYKEKQEKEAFFSASNILQRRRESLM